MEMDPNNLQPPLLYPDNWRYHLESDSRQRIVDESTETLKRHLPYSDLEPQEIRWLVIEFEEKIYNAATSQSDYLQKISLKMLATQSNSETILPNGMPSMPAGVSSNHEDI